MTLEDLLNCNVNAELARRNMLDFVCYVKPDYQVNWHHELLCKYIDDFVNKKIRRLMIFIPPQHGKSQIVSRSLPAFILGRNPKAKIVLASYSADLSSSFNRDCQRIIESEEYQDVFQDTKLNGKSSTERGSWLKNTDIFETVGHGGFLKTTGVGGSLTGTPADYAIIDDPVKDSVEAMSPTYQERNWNWYNDVLFTRIHNDSSILLTQTRWDVNDLAGKLLQSMENGVGEQWTILNLPAIRTDYSNPEDPREIGEALWESRHGKEKLMMVRAQSIRTFEALYQQNPRPTQAGGEAYHQFRIEKHTLKLDYNKDLPLHLTFDFNTSPYMTLCIWQMLGKKAIQTDEICLSSPRSTTRDTCREFARKYNGHESGVFIYGDPSGKKEDTRFEKGHNDFTIILSELKLFKPTLRLLPKAPSVAMRMNFINTVFESNYLGCEIQIGINCKNSIEDYAYLKQDADGGKLKEKAKDMATGVSYERRGHTSDANDYFLCYVFAKEYANYLSGGRNGVPHIGKNVSKNNY